MKPEHRMLHPDSAELRVATDSGKVASGYAAVFNSLSEDLGGFRERIAPGAFKRSLEAGDVVALWSHNSDAVLGRTSAKTLRLWENSKGLFFNLDLPDTNAGHDAHVSISRGDVRGASFGFRVPVGGDKWERQDSPDGTPATLIRTLLEVELLEISPTAFPAYPQTAVSARSLDEVLAAGRAAIEATEKAAEPPTLEAKPEPRTPFARLRAKVLNLALTHFCRAA